MARPRKSDNQPDTELETRVAELEAALRPFAIMGRKLRRTDPRGGARKILLDQGGHELTLGDFDAAMRALGDDHG